MTDEEVIQVLAKRLNYREFQMGDENRGGKWYRGVKWYELPNGHIMNIRAFAEKVVNSRDALAPVMVGLADAEKHRLSTRLWGKFHQLPEYSSEVYATWLLTLPPRDLAHAIAETIASQSVNK